MYAAIKLLCYPLLIGRLSDSVLFSFTLHTEPRVNPPEFTVTCQTQGGPAQHVQWFLNQHSFKSQNETLFNQSKVIVSFHSDSVYNNSIYVRGRLSGMYKCLINNSVSSCSAVGNITGVLMLIKIIITIIIWIILQLQKSLLTSLL